MVRSEKARDWHGSNKDTIRAGLCWRANLRREIAAALAARVAWGTRGKVVPERASSRVFSNSGMSLERTAVDVAKRVDLLIGDAV